MKSGVLWALLALNVALLVMFVFRSTATQPAMAQGMGRPGDYLMIPGEVIGGTDAVVYVLDQSSRELSAMVYDDSTKKAQTMPAVDLDRVFNGGAPGNGPGYGNNRRPR